MPRSLRQTQLSVNERPKDVGGVIDWCVAQLEAADLCFAHGTDNARDEAAALVFHVAGLDHHGASAQYRRRVNDVEFGRITSIVEQRIERRMPLPYVLREAWFAGLSFFVDQRVLIPRSPFAELLEDRFSPWWRMPGEGRILDIGTGSGCIAVAAAVAFPGSEVLATDVQADALEVAAINVAQHRLAHRISLQQADLFDGVMGRFDLILANPPYVPEQEIGELPPEFAYEPMVALRSGTDGLDSARRILQDARNFLRPGGLLALEVGTGRTALEAAFPNLPFVWPDFAHGGEGIALLTAEQLDASVPISHQE